ncbi:MAG: ComF family protein [Elusimicrobiota bacterium]
MGGILDVLSDLKETLSYLLFPSVCFYCKRDIPYKHKDPLCPDCLKKIFYISPPYCLICGRYLYNGGMLCYSCLHKKQKSFFDFSRSVFMYGEEISSVIVSYKYRKFDWLSEWLSQKMIERFKTYSEFNEYDLITYVPISKRKLKERGFNQTELLAKNLSKYFNIELVEAVKKIKDSRNQVELNAKEREENVKDSFEVILPEKVKDRKIIVIDDVATTMSTLNEIAKVLKKAKAKKVACYTIARE